MAAFVLLSAALIPYAGVQHDEALFAAPLYELKPKELCISIFHRQVPLMVMSYVGTLKTALYIPVLHYFGVNLWSVRLPMALAGALTIFFFYELSSIAAGRRAGLIAALLLFSDPSFLLTDTFDWGPVALEHLLLVTGCFFLLRFARNILSMRDLAAGFFFLGLALWNKAIFLWALAGLITAAIIVLHRELRKLVRPRNTAVAACAFLIGSLPFVLYNIRRPNATLDSNAHFESPRIAVQKFPMLHRTLNGRGLFGFLTHDVQDTPLKTPRSVRGRVAAWIHSRAGDHYQNGFDAAFLLSLVCILWWRRSRAAWFSLIFIAVTWTAMVFSEGGGGAVHHTVLIWPFPQLFLGVVLASLPWRRAAILATAILLAMNLLVVNQYIFDFERAGAAGSFTDALMPLMKAIPDPPKLDVEHIYIADWGIFNTLALFHEGRLPIFVGDSPFLSDSPSLDDLHAKEFMLTDRGGLFIGHTPAYEVNPVRARIEKAAAARGRRKQVLQIIYDSNGRAVFEIYRIVDAL